MDFSKFQKNFILKIVGAHKSVYEESYEKGQGEYAYGSIPDFLNDSFTIPIKKISEQYIEKLVLSHLREQLGCDTLVSTWITIDNDDNIIISINEIEEYYTQYCPDIKAAEDEGKQVYLSNYKIKLFINNMKVVSEDLKNIFSKCEIM